MSVETPCVYPRGVQIDQIELIDQTLFHVRHVCDAIKNRDTLRAPIQLAFQHINGALVAFTDDRGIRIFAED